MNGQMGGCKRPVMNCSQQSKILLHQISFESRRTRRAEESNKKHLEAEFMGSHPVQKLADRFAVRRSKSAANQLKHLNKRIDSGNNKMA